jgi:hypothetical protein
MEVRYLHVPGKEPTGTNSIVGWLGPRGILDAVEKRKILHCWKSKTDSSVIQPVT